jgi:flagellar L-ring protein precursor FlgH
MSRPLLIKFIAVCVATTALTACGMTDRIENIGKAPALSPITNPMASPDYRPVSLPMPREEEAKMEPNSLWASNRQTFFKDQRARKIGDILTVTIAIDDEAKLSNQTKRDRAGSDSVGVPALAGFESNLNNILPEAADVTNLVETNSTSSSSGKGTVDRKEEIDLQLAAVVTQILPNGNMVVQGRQEVRVNFENRVLELVGVIRPEDIETNNKISYEKIAEARISYGGKGHITDVQQPRYGQQFYDIVLPF